MRPDPDFAKRLEQEFQGRLRIRWSVQRHTWEIEQKVGRAAYAPIRWLEHDDSFVRARDGYVHVLSIAPGTRVPCEFCHLDIKIPVREFRETRCEYCHSKGKDTTTQACYWPLGESLLDHLRRVDPMRDGHRRMVKDMDMENQRREATKEKDQQQLLRDHIFEIAMEQIPKVGYTGHEQYL